MATKPTITLVARKARVATSTVSRVMNGGYASSKTRARVQRVIAELGYKPWSVARNFKLGRAGAIGVVVESSQGAWFTQVLGGIESELVQRRISVLLSSLALSGAFDTAQVMAWMSEQRIDALLLARPGKRERPLVEAAARAGLPIALIGPDEDFGEGHVVRSLNREAGREVGQHLFALGHQRVAFVGGPECSIDTRDRLAGLRKGLAEHDLELAPPSVQFSSSYDPEAGMAYADHWLEQPQSRVPTAVVFGNDALAHGFMRAVQQEGIVVPRDVSVVGFDDVPESALTWPGLTTSRQQSRAMGAAACRAVVRQIDNPSPRETTLLEFPTELVVRESTGAAPAYGRKTLLQAR